MRGLTVLRGLRAINQESNEEERQEQMKALDKLREQV